MKSRIESLGEALETAATIPIIIGFVITIVLLIMVIVPIQAALILVSIDDRMPIVISYIGRLIIGIEMLVLLVFVGTYISSRKKSSESEETP